MIRYELADHTADVAVVLHGRDEAEAYASAAWALADLLCDAARVAARVARPVDARGADAAETAVRLMNDLLYLWDAEGLVLPVLEVEEATPVRVRGTVRGEPLDPDAHGFKGSLKAATYHDLAVERDAGGIHIRITLDV